MAAGIRTRPSPSGRRVTCPRCGSIVPAGVSVCPVCGSKLPKARQTITCRYCGYKADARLRVCPSCGRALRPRPFYRTWRFYITLFLLFALFGLSVRGDWHPQKILQNTTARLREQAEVLMPQWTPLAVVIIPSPTPTFTYTPTYTPTMTPTVTPTPTVTWTPTPTVTPTPVPPVRKYVVQPGDTPESIAKRFGVPVRALLQANGLTPSSLIHVGDVLVIPVNTPTPTPTHTPTS